MIEIDKLRELAGPLSMDYATIKQTAVVERKEATSYAPEERYAITITDTSGSKGASSVVVLSGRDVAPIICYAEAIGFSCLIKTSGAGADAPATAVIELVAND